MSTTSAFRIPVANLLRRPGASRTVQLEGALSDVRGPGAQVTAGRPIAVDLTLERVSEGMVVRGTITAPWDAACSRCLVPVGGDLEVQVGELYERQPLEGETYLLSDDDVVDLEPLIRDALLLELPAVPLCRSVKTKTSLWRYASGADGLPNASWNCWPTRFGNS